MSHIMYMPELRGKEEIVISYYLQNYTLYIEFPYDREVVYDMTLLQYYRKEMKSGDRVYVNAISCTTRDVNSLRMLVQTGKLKPDEEILRKCVIESAVPAFMDGTCIFPQMDYIKQ